MEGQNANGLGRERPRWPLTTSLRRSARRTLDVLDARRRLWGLGRHVNALRAVADGDADAPVRLAGMRSAWGNEGWSADLEYLCAVARRMRGVTGPVLECGSGLTTIVMGVLAERLGVRVLSLEQDPCWAAFVRSRLSRFRISSVRLVESPLKVYDGFLWFDVDELELPDAFELAVCDGPAIYGQAEPYQTAWRVGLLPVLRERGVRVQEILLDDADDSRSQAVYARWEREHGYTTQIVHAATGPYSVARSPERVYAVGS